MAAAITEELGTKEVQKLGSRDLDTFHDVLSRRGVSRPGTTTVGTRRSKAFVRPEPVSSKSDLLLISERNLDPTGCLPARRRTAFGAGFHQQRQPV